ncbi:G5 domain-containing protein [Trichococcus shcherbakoviae]|uniref:Uncharacterized protein n=1 Tax=Trichococcus shcherbakoviae TaxID=2094020 RepID=A0A383TC22_9LACT|nr:G5 domain-containing protein [Trichococcus shcherbakoviae]SYZ77900.1 Hypothetical protein TART1_0671 [Trichococcus shcherbakoviae]
MRKVLRKVKSQWAVLGIMGATVIALGAVDVPQISADEIEGATTSESVAGSESGAGSAILEVSENAVQTNSQKSEDSTNAVTQAVISEFAEPQTPSEVSEEVPAAEEVDYATILSTIDVEYPAVISRDTDAINTAPWGIQGYQTIGLSAYYVGRTVDVIKEQVTDYGVTWALVSMNGKELGWIAKDALTAQTYAAIVSETAVEYSATISRATDAINTSPWGMRGYQTIASSADYAGKAVEVMKEATTDYGVTWALVSLDGKELGWIAKDALTIQTYAAIVSETAVEYPAVISRDTDAINTAPWGTKGYQTISTSAAYAGQIVEVTNEQTTDYGVTWAQISLNGESLGWIAKEALTAQTYAQVTKETAVAYSAAIARDSDAINTAPWGTKGYQTLATSAAYVGQTIEVTKEQETDYGVTWAQVSLNGKVFGWIAKDALKVQTYAQITEETTVDYSATISRETDAINTAPWGTKGYQTLASSADYRDQTVEVTKEQVTDYGVTWAQISLNGEVLGWIAKDALTVQSYSKIVKETAVDYQATITRGTDAINTAPWGTKGYQTVGSSADYLGKTVKVSKEQITDYGVTWVFVSLNGKELGWVAKACLNEQTDEVVVDGETYEERTMAPESYYTFIGEDVKNVIPAVTKDVIIPAVIEHVEAVYTTVQVPILDEDGNETGEFIDEQQLFSEAYDKVIVPERLETVVVTPERTVIEREDTLMYETPYEIITRYDGSIPEGTTYVETKGAYGLEVIPVTVTTENGVVSEVRGSGEFIFAPTTEVVVVGTQKVVTVVTNTFEETTTVPYKIVTVEDDSLMVGETIIDQVGQDGIVVKTYTQKTTDGVIGEKIQVGNAVETESVNQIVRVGTKEVKQEARETAISFGTVYQNDESAYTDSSVVTTEGQNGIKVTTYDVTYVKGQKVSETAVAEEVTVAPVNKVITVGTKAIETTGTVTETEEVAFETITKYDTNMAAGTEVVETEGQTGTKEISYTVTYNNGEEVSRTVASEVVTKAPVNKVVVVGAQTIEVKQEVVSTPVAYEREFSYDDTKLVGTVEVISEGVEGVKETTYNVTYVNGVKTSEEKVSARITVAPIRQVVVYGTKEVVEDVVEMKQETNTDPITFETVTVTDATKDKTYSEVTTEGQDGVMERTYDITYVNGERTSSELASEKVLQAPINKVITVGTRLTEVKSETTTENEVGFTTVEEEDNTIPLGQRVTVQSGANGYDAVTYDVTYFNGVESGRVEVSRITTAPIDKIVAVGSNVELISNNVMPELSNIEFGTGTVAAGSSVQITANVLGSVNSDSSLQVTLTSEGTNQSKTIELSDLGNGLYQGTFDVNQFSEPGKWRISNVALNYGLSTLPLTYTEELNRVFYEKTVVVENADALDTTGPVIQNIVFEGSSVNAGDRVKVTATATDDLSGVDYIQIALRYYGSYQRAYVKLYKESENTYSGYFDVSEYAAPGKWSIVSVSGIDMAGNVTTTTSNATIQVINNGPTDMQSPQIQNISLNKDIVEYGESIQVTMTVKDNLSGVDGVWALAEYIGDLEIDENIYQSQQIELQRLSDDTLVGYFKLDKYMAAGNWRIYFMYASDTLGNVATQYPNKEWDTSFEYVNANEPDLKLPVIESVTVDKDVVRPGERVQITAIIQDDLSGVDPEEIIAAVGNDSTISTVEFYQTSENTFVGYYYVDDNTPSGELNVVSIGALDNVGNSIGINNYEMIGDNFDITFTVEK